MTAPEPTKCPACTAGLWTPDCTFATDDPTPEPPAYLDPVRHELHQLRADNDRMRAAIAQARTWIANCVDPAEVGVDAKQRMLDALMPHSALADKEPTP